MDVVLEDEDPSFADLHFKVKDTGIGISEQKKQKIFQAFTQEDMSTTRRFGGTGLGLTISKTLVEMMGGSVWLDSKLHHGSTFHFTVRLKKISARLPDQAPSMEFSQIAGPEQKVESESNGLDVLLAEDGLVNQKVATAFLRDLGHRVTLAVDGNEALEQVRSGTHFDLILMDVLMPEMDGLEATRAIRRHERETGSKRVPILALTAQAMKDDRQTCLDAGMDGYISKPFRKEQLMDSIEQLVESQAGTEAPNG